MEPSPGFLGTDVMVRDEKMVQVSQEIREQKGKSEAGKQKGVNASEERGKGTTLSPDLKEKLYLNLLHLRSRS